MLKPAQLSKFFTAVTAAWREHIRINKLADNYEQMDAWYRDEMAKVCAEAGIEIDAEYYIKAKEPVPTDGKVDSIKKINHIEGYDAVMLHWAIIAGDDRQIAYFSSAVERRYRNRIKILMSTVGELEMQHVGWDYVCKIAEHMNIPKRIEECPPSMLLKLIQALDTHRRRILASRGELETRKPGLGAKRWDREYHYRKAK